MSVLGFKEGTVDILELATEASLPEESNSTSCSLDLVGTESENGFFTEFTDSLEYIKTDELQSTDVILEDIVLAPKSEFLVNNLSIQAFSNYLKNYLDIFGGKK